MKPYAINAKTALHYIETGLPVGAMLSIRNPDDPPIADQEVLDGLPYPFLELRFLDTMTAYGGPTLAQLEQAIAFMRGLDSEGPRAVCIHCTVGVSRSVALTVIRLYLLGLSEDECFENLKTYTQTNNPFPNIALLQMADQILGSNLDAAYQKHLPGAYQMWKLYDAPE